MRIPARIHQNDAKLSESERFSPIKHLFRLKTSKNGLSIYESVHYVGVPGRILSRFLSVFMHFYEGLNDFRIVFWLLLSFFDRFLSHFRPIRRPMGHFSGPNGTKIGSFWGDSEPFLCRRAHCTSLK